MMELRVLNGLHQGAVIPLDDEPVVLGGSLRADLNLADPGITENHLTIEPAGQGYRLVPGEGRLWDRNLVRLRGPQTLSEDSRRLCLAGIWVEFASPEQPWTDGEALPSPGATNAMAKQGQRKGLVPLSIGALAITFWTLAMAQGLTTSDSGPEPTETAGLPNVDYTDPSDPTLQARFREMLRERRIHSGVELAIEDDHWVVQGTLAEDKLAVFKRMLSRFNRKHHPDFDVRSEVSAKRYELPFEVVQVNSGRYASILTDDGARLFEGDSKGGYTLISVESDRLVFQGPETVAMAW